MGVGRFDKSLNFRGYPKNEENPRISRIAVSHCICTAPCMIRKGVRKGGRISRTLVGPHNAIYVICNASNVNFFTKFSARRAHFFSAVGKILDLVSVFCKAKKWAQNRNWNEILPYVEDITRWMSKKGSMDLSNTYENVGYVDSC